MSAPGVLPSLGYRPRTSMLVRVGANNFNTIRLGMALLVVWSHSFALHLGSEKTEWVSLLLAGVYNAGNLAVMAFFIISGFLILQSWERSISWKSYISKRVRRIYPGYIVATTICAFIIAPLFGGRFPDASSTIINNIFLQNRLPDAFPQNVFKGSINGSLWSIPYEFWCYIGVLVAGKWLLRRRLHLVALCLLLALGQVAQDVTGKRPGLGPLDFLGWPYLWTKMAPCFLLGMLVYAYKEVLPRNLALLGLLAVVAVLSCHVSVALATILVAPTLAYAVMIAAFSQRVIPDAAILGDFSYGTYLYAFPIQQMLQATIGRDWPLPFFILVSMFLSLIAAAISWYAVEQHFLWIRK